MKRLFQFIFCCFVLGVSACSNQQLSTQNISENSAKKNISFDNEQLFSAVAGEIVVISGRNFELVKRYYSAAGYLCAVLKSSSEEALFCNVSKDKWQQVRNVIGVPQ